MLRRQLQRYARAVLLIGLVMAGGLACTVFILSQERFASPFASSYTINAPFTSVAGVAPALGEPVNVAGVQVGQISGASLLGGHGVLHLKIDPRRLAHVYANARAVLVPISPLKDMQVELTPGGTPAAPLPDGATLPVEQTTSPINSDDLLAALDSDTRAWMITLLSGLDRGTRGRTADLRTLYELLGPTTEQVRRIGDVLTARRRQVARLVANLSTLSRAAGARDREIATVVTGADATLGALAEQEASLRSSVSQLPGTLATLRSTLGHTTAFADTLGPTLSALEPSLRQLAPTLRDSRALLSGGGLLPVRRLRPFVGAILPLAGDLPPTVTALRRGTPALVRAFGVLGSFTNELAYSRGANPGFLYWLAWFGQNFDSVYSTEDANGAVVRGLALVSCNSLASNPALKPVIQTLLGSSGLCA